MAINDIMKELTNSLFEIDSHDPICKWLKQNNKFQDNLDLVGTLKEMPADMAKEFLRRMITSQAIPHLDSKTLKHLAKLAFAKK